MTCTYKPSSNLASGKTVVKHYVVDCVKYDGRLKRMYPFKRYLDDNQIGALPPGVFTYNTELTDL